MSFQNVREAETIVALLMDLRRKSNRLHGNELWFSIRRIRVITFYRAQVELISILLRTYGLHQIEISSVDSSQGSEADLIIVSFVRTGGINGVGFLSDVRRLNVALTRAKYKLICVGNSTSLLQGDGINTTTIKSLIQNAIDREVVVSTYAPKFHPNHMSQKKRSNSQHYKGNQPPKRDRRGR